MYTANYGECDAPGNHSGTRCPGTRQRWVSGRYYLTEEGKGTGMIVKLGRKLRETDKNKLERKGGWVT